MVHIAKVYINGNWVETCQFDTKQEALEYAAGWEADYALISGQIDVSVEIETEYE